MLTLRQNQRGFSLVELLVGLAITAILLSAAVPNFKAWIQNTQVRTAAESISAGVQLARAEAVRRNTSVTFSLPGTDSSWNFGCATAVGDLNGDGVDDCPQIIQSRSGSEGTKNAEIVASVPSITFNGLGRANSALTVNLANSIGGTCKANGGDIRCLNILVTIGGQVRMCDPALATTDPQGC